MKAIKCDVCGKFTKWRDLHYQEDDYERWLECVRCLPQAEIEKLTKQKSKQESDHA